ncbi:MAG: hypothetical protein GY949_19975 [Gammaproteobacteria bacterium]|nr:hypothetical protein [Gammaproteobacteria bacterium]
MRHITCITLLLAITASNLLVGVHATWHAPADLGQCELCAAYGDPSDATPSAGLSLATVGPQYCAPQVLAEIDAGTVVLGFWQRGPPHIL